MKTPEFPSNLEDQNEHVSFEEGIQSIARMLNSPEASPEVLSKSLLANFRGREFMGEIELVNFTFSKLEFADQGVTLWVHYRGPGNSFSQKAVDWIATCSLIPIKKLVDGAMQTVLFPNWKVISKSKMEAIIRKNRSKRP